MKGGFKSLMLQKAEVSRNGKRLLGPLNLTLATSGITAILGHNGAGKSLFMYMAHGQFTPSKGSVLWNDLSAEATRSCRSFMFQNAPLMRRSVTANVEFPLIAQGVAKPDRQTRVATALEQARLSHRATAPAASLSGGEKQRMALARALVTRPQVIMLDEPSASLDPASTKELEENVRLIADSGVKVLIATHDLMQARRLADDVLVFGGGSLLVQAATADFFGQPQKGPVADFLEGRL